MSVVPKRPFFYRETDGIRITVRPAYLREQSRPAERQYVFVYHVRVENVSGRTAQLMSRRWEIHDSIDRTGLIPGNCL